MKPIEPGCFVLVTGCERRDRYVGLCLVVEAVVAHGDIRPDGSIARPASRIGIICTNSQDPRGFSQHNPRHLMRIDDGDELIEQGEDLEVTA